MEKEFVDIPNFKGYKINKEGIVMSYKFKNPRIMRTYKIKNSGDKIVDLRVNGKYKSMRINTLLSLTFGSENDYKDFIDIKGYEGLYKINRNGDIISISDNRIRYKKDIFMSKTLVNGYYKVMLTKNGISSQKFVHRLIAEAFIPNPNNYSCINHKDECRTNNSIDNLEWCTHEYNLNYGTRTERAIEKLSIPVKMIDTITNKETIFKSYNDAYRNTGCFDLNIRLAVKTGSLYKNRYKFVNP